MPVVFDGQKYLYKSTGTFISITVFEQRIEGLNKSALQLIQRKGKYFFPKALSLPPIILYIEFPPHCAES